MTFHDHPEQTGWMVGPETDLREALPASPDESLMVLSGAARGDWEQRLYLVPLTTSIEEIIDFFEVGTNRAVLHGWDERDTMDLIGNTLDEVNAIVPGSIERASPSELWFRFWRRLRLDELEQIEAVYHKVDDYQAGLEAYLNGGSGDSILAEVKESGVLRLCWQ